MSEFNMAFEFRCGAIMKNHFGLAPMTNCQSLENGLLSDDEFTWLTKRAEGGFGLTMTCASHVQEIGKGFPGQLGIFSDKLMHGHKRLAAGIKHHGSLAVIQLHHAGLRSPEKLIGEEPVSPSVSEKHGSRALSLKEVHQLRDDFIEAAVRSQKCGYDGVEIHGAHGYILAQFLSNKINRRTDEYGGSLENRARIVFEIIAGIRKKCGENFLLGLRLSPERFGMVLSEIKMLCKQLIEDGQLDFLDISLWDSFKMPEEEVHQAKSLLKHFTDMDFKDMKLTVAGKIMTAKDVRDLLEAGVDFVSIGRAAILHHDFPKRVNENAQFESTPLPVSRTYLANEGLGEKFINYMSGWPDFVVK
jgi:2,4-dienoyl-CoA reductase-like NADH-dependent reductase (Old Yellow Enzyme family)